MSGKRKSRAGENHLSSPLDSHHREARRENALWLMEECGLSLEGAANRLGVSLNTLEKDLDRHPERRSA